MKIFLVGLPGVGKTFQAKRLADFLNYEFVDLDAEIEKSEGQSISTIFSEKGEEAFRKKESEVLRQIVYRETHTLVIACGGGTPCFSDNLSEMKNSGLTVYLTDSMNHIIRRLLTETSRPLFSKEFLGNPESALELMWQKRREFYEQTHIIADVSSLLDLHLFTKRVELFTDRA
ncbi:MAG: AAA family ATPase [Bacteroidetes bacterium]|nr:AAA family ATPase [Bacteroidota bacterium]